MVKAVIWKDGTIQFLVDLHVFFCACMHANWFFSFLPTYRKIHSIEGPTGNPKLDGIRAKVIQARELHEYSSGSK